MNQKTKDRQIQEALFFQKHNKEGKSVTKCSEEMGLSRVTLHDYKRGDNYRQMALACLDGKTLGGVSGTMTRLVKALEATRPLVVVDKTTRKDKKTGELLTSEKTRIEQVADQATRMKALQEIHKIYGIYAPQKRDVKVEISVSSDADLFREIDEAASRCKHVDSYEVREGSFELAPGTPGSCSGDFETRKRTLLQHAPIQEP